MKSRKVKECVRRAVRLNGRFEGVYQNALACVFGYPDRSYCDYDAFDYLPRATKRALMRACCKAGI